MPMPPTVDHLEFERVLGSGAFATVWLAHDVMLERRVAVKVLAENWAANLDVRRRFLREAQIIVDAESRRLIRGYAAGLTRDERPYMVMAWADRGTLEDRFAGIAVAPSVACAIVAEVAFAVADVHALGHLHRDVKPSNVLIMSGARPGVDAPVTGLEPDERLVLGDFGLSRGLDSSALTLVAGSPGYIAPEQAAGLEQLDARADIFPLGVMLLELLTGRRATSATTMQAARDGIDADSALAGAGTQPGPAVRTLLWSLLATDPAGRPDSATSAADALRRMGGAPHGFASTPPANGPSSFGPAAAVTVPPPPGTGGVQPDAGPSGGRRGRRVGVIAGGAIAVAVAAGAIAVAAWPDDDTSGPSTSTSAAAPDDSAAPSTSAPTSTAVSPSTSDAVTTTTAAAIDDPQVAPVPPAAVVSTEDQFQRVADVAATIDDIEAFYVALDGGWRLDGQPTGTAEERTLPLRSSDRSATITLTPAALSAGAGITRIHIVYSS